jgi:long-chain acyl-CoA synthetase
LNHSETKILIVSNSGLLNKVLLEKEHLKFTGKIILMEELAAIFSRGAESKFEKVSLNPDDCCSIIYTSGTTGEPKGVMLSHRNFLSEVDSITEIIPITSEDVFLSFLPLSHVLERTAGYYAPLCHGCAIAYAENAKQLPVNLREVKPTILISVPRVFEKFHDAIWDKINSGLSLQKRIFKWALRTEKNTFAYKIANFLVFKKIRQQMGGKLRITVSGGASLNANIAKFFSKIGILILEGYGLTETSPVVSVNRENDFKFGTVGKALPGVKVKISDSSKEILVKGPNVFCGYLKNEEGSRKCFDKDSWFCTGDLGFMDKQGFLTIIGRAKEMIVTSGGKNVWPEPIENLLNNDRFISQSIVVGNNRKFISALIVPDWQEIEIYFKQNNLPLREHSELIKSPVLADIFQKRIDEKINPGLNDFEKIKKFKLLPQEFSQDREELTATLKLRRHIVEHHHQKTIEAMYDIIK